MRFPLVLLLLCGTASADDVKNVTVRVTATATSAMPKSPAWRAIGQITAERNGWCPNKGDGVGESIKLAFDEPLPLTALRISAGHDADWQMQTSKEYNLPEKVEIETDKQTLEATLQRTTRTNDENQIALSGAPTRTITVKILAVKPGKVAQTCINSIHFDAPHVEYRPVYGIEKDALTKLRGFAGALDDAFKRCNETVLGQSITFPLTHEHVKLDDVTDGGGGNTSTTVTYKSVGDFVKDCKRPGSPLQLGYAGEPGSGRDPALIEDLAEAFSDHAGTVRLGDWSTHAWWLTWVDGGWRLTQLLSSEDALRAPKTAITELAGEEIDAWNQHDTKPDLVFTPDATLVLVQRQSAVVAAAKAGEMLPGVHDVKSHKESDVSVTLARDHHAAVLSFTTKLHGAKDLTYRVSELVVRHDSSWLIAGGVWSEAKANDAVNKAAAAGAIGTWTRVAPPSAMEDNPLIGGFFAMQKGPLDATAATRKDLIVFGSGPGERTVGGATFAKPWATAWANHVPLDASGLASKFAPTGKTGWVATDIMLEKHDAQKHLYLVPFRIWLVFDETVDGTWTLLHAHLATIAP